jgi:hypothetical protein
VVVARLGKQFAEVIPLALHVMTHPSFDPASLRHAHFGGPDALLKGLAERLEALARREELALPSPAATARLLVSLAHDWALRHVHSNKSGGARELKDMVNVVWQGLWPRSK